MTLFCRVHPIPSIATQKLSDLNSTDIKRLVRLHFGTLNYTLSINLDLFVMPGKLEHTCLRRAIVPVIIPICSFSGP